MIRRRFRLYVAARRSGLEGLSFVCGRRRLVLRSVLLWAGAPLLSRRLRLPRSVQSGIRLPYAWLQDLQVLHITT